MSRPSRLRVACIQINAGRDFSRNLKRLFDRIPRVLKYRPDVLALPEIFYWRGPSERLPEIAARVTPGVISEFRALARSHGVAVLLGSVVEAVRGERRFANTSILIDERGRIAARYRKIHLFDVALPRVKVQESEHILPGRHVAVGTVQGIRAGLSVCYDLRFPELYRALSRRGAEMIFVPANFTFVTGKAHWEVLLRSRAIENQSYVIAPAQAGIHPDTGIRSFGTSLIADPWGRILAKASAGREETLVADLDFESLRRLRNAFPVLKHRRLF